MSQTKFTPVTSRLLARKGDAVPSVVASKPWSFNKSVPPPITGETSAPPDAVEAVSPPGPPETGKPHKMTVLLTASEFEKLGIAAVKKGITRHQIVRTALDLHLERLQQEYSGCACMTADGPCGESCGAA